jgi:formate dehydrogenase major subunit
LARLGVGKPRFEARAPVAADLSHPAIAVNLDACIQCTRCLRACRDEQVNDVIGWRFRGEQAKIVFDMDDPMGASTCVACGECVQACPTGALMPARDAALAVPDKQVESLCPFCGVGCQLTYNVKDNQILYVEGRDGPANQGRLCVKGRYGFRLRAPPAPPHRAAGPPRRRTPKRGDMVFDPDRVMEVFREASWDEALALPAAGWRHARRTGPRRAGRLRLGQGQQRGGLPVPEAGAHRLRQQQRRPLHAAVPCVVGGGAAGGHRLRRGVEPGDGRDPGRGGDPDRRQPDREPPGGGDLDQERGAMGTKLIVCDPRRSELARLSHRFLQFKPDTDVAMLNAMMHVIVEEGLVDEAFVASAHDRLRGAAAQRRRLQPGAMAPICGIDADTIREVARPVRHVEGVDDPVGHGRQRSTCTAPTTHAA